MGGLRERQDSGMATNGLLQPVSTGYPVPPAVYTVLSEH